MKNQNHYKTDYDFLKPLLDRPDLEPDPTFIISLRKKIIKSNNSKFRLPRNLNFIGVGLLAILTLSLLIYTFDFGGHSTGTLVNQAFKEPGFGVENDVDKSIEGDWKESPLFESGSDTLIGEEGRLGFSYDDGEILRFYPDKTQKYIWYFWGEEKEFNGVLKFIGTHENDEKQSVVYGGDFYKANNKADRQVHISMNLPKSGMWRLDAYIGDKLFGTVFVKVHTQSSENATSSQDENSQEKNSQMLEKFPGYVVEKVTEGESEKVLVVKGITQKEALEATFYELTGSEDHENIIWFVSDENHFQGIENGEQVNVWWDPRKMHREPSILTLVAEKVEVIKD